MTTGTKYSLAETVEALNTLDNPASILEDAVKAMHVISGDSISNRLNAAVAPGGLSQACKEDVRSAYRTRSTLIHK